MLEGKNGSYVIHLETTLRNNAEYLVGIGRRCV